MPKTALVTGGAQGIGRAIALGLLSDGWAVGVIDVQESFPDSGAVPADRAVAYRKADVSDPTALGVAFAEIADHLGSITALVNNAGIYPRARVDEIDYEAWMRVIEVNLGGMFNCARLFRAQVGTEQSAAIVNVASSIAFQGAPRGSHYAASKAGVVGLTRALAIEFAPQVRVNAVVPGVTFTAQVAAGGRTYADIVAYAQEEVPLGRPCTPEDIFKAVRFLIGPDAEYITGQLLFVNGGSYMH